MELEGKELGCCCNPSSCHGDVLVKLFKERQGNFVNGTLNSAPLRLTGGGDTSFECHEEVEEDVSSVSNENDLLSTALENSMSEQDIRDALFEAGYTLDEINDTFAGKVEAALDPLNFESSCGY